MWENGIIVPQMINKKIKELKIGCGNMTFIMEDGTELYIEAKDKGKMKIVFQYFKKEHHDFVI